MIRLRSVSYGATGPLRALALAAAVWLAGVSGAFAQASVAMWCWNPTGSSAQNNQYLPCNAANPLVVSATFSPSGTQNVNLTQILGAAPSLTNPLFVSPATGATFAVSGTITAAAPIGITPTDRTITSATGASQTIMAANASRHSTNFVNTGNANCGVNPTGGAAVIGGAGTLTLSPLGSYSPGIPTLSAITVICTAGQPIYADEN